MKNQDTGTLVTLDLAAWVPAALDLETKVSATYSTAEGSGGVTKGHQDHCGGTLPDRACSLGKDGVSGHFCWQSHHAARFNEGKDVHH